MATLDPRSALVHRLKFLSVVQELAKADFESAVDTVGLDSLEELSGGIGILPRDLQQQQQSSNRRDRYHTSPHRQPLRDSSNRYGSNQYNIRVNSTRYGTGSRIQLEDDDGDDYDEEGRYTGSVTKPHAPHLHTTERGRRVQPSERDRGGGRYVDAYTATNKPSIRNHHGRAPTGTTRAERLRQQAREDREYRLELERRERAQGGYGAQEAGWDSRFFSLPSRDAVDVGRRGSNLRRKPPAPIPAEDIAEEEGNMYAALPRTGSHPPPQRSNTRFLNSPLDPHAATYSGGGDTNSPSSGAAGHVLPRITFSSGDLAHANSTGALDSAFGGEDEPTTRYGAHQLPPPSPNLLPHPSMIRCTSNNELLQTTNSVNLNASTSGLNDTSRSCATPLGGSGGVRLVRTSSRGPKAKPRTTSGGTPVNIPLSPAAVPDKVVDRVAQVMHNLGRQTDFSKLQSSNAKKESTMDNLKSAIDARIDNAVNEHMMDIRRSQQRSGSSPDTNQSGSAQQSPFVGAGESFGHEGPTPTDGRASSGIRAYSPTRQAIVSRDPPPHSAGQEAVEANPFGTYETIRTSDSPFEMEDEEGGSGDDEKGQSRTQRREYSASNSPNRSSKMRRQQQHQREEISHLSDLLDQMLGDHAMVQLRSEKGLSRLLEGSNPDEQDEVDRARMMRLKRMQQELHGAMQKTDEMAEGDDRAAQAELELDRIRRQLVEQDKEELRARNTKQSENQQQKPNSPHAQAASSKKRPATQRGFIPSSTVRAIQAAQATQHEVLRHNEDLWNSSSTSQYAFAARLTNVLIDDLVGELSVEMDSMLGEYVEGLAAHELR